MLFTVQVMALGFVSVFDQILDGYSKDDQQKIFTAYIAALGEDASQYRVSSCCMVTVSYTKQQ